MYSIEQDTITDEYQQSNRAWVYYVGRCENIRCTGRFLVWEVAESLPDEFQNMFIMTLFSGEHTIAIFDNIAIPREEKLLQEIGYSLLLMTFLRDCIQQAKEIDLLFHLCPKRYLEVAEMLGMRSYLDLTQWRNKPAKEPWYFDEIATPLIFLPGDEEYLKKIKSPLKKLSKKFSKVFPDARAKAASIVNTIQQLKGER